MHRIFEKLNCDVTELFFDMDGRFPNHHPDPTVPKNLAQLVKTVKEEGADLGFLPTFEIHRRQRMIKAHLDAVAARPAPGPAEVAGKQFRFTKLGAKACEIEFE